MGQPGNQTNAIVDAIILGRILNASDAEAESFASLTEVRAAQEKVGRLLGIELGAPREGAPSAQIIQLKPECHTIADDTGDLRQQGREEHYKKRDSREEQSIDAKRAQLAVSIEPKHLSQAPLSTAARLPMIRTAAALTALPLLGALVMYFCIHDSADGPQPSLVSEGRQATPSYAQVAAGVSPELKSSSIKLAAASTSIQPHQQQHASDTNHAAEEEKAGVPLVSAGARAEVPPLPSKAPIEIPSIIQRANEIIAKPEIKSYTAWLKDFPQD